MAAPTSLTPFGQRKLSLGHIASQMVAEAARPAVVVHKWQVFASIREARALIGASDRSLAILHALLSFHPETALVADGRHIVWPSNDQLAARANGMPASTLRRHIAILVDCGLIIRRDSPNGKRFARKGSDGEVEQAFGFDLSPLVARADEFAALAHSVQVEKKALRLAKERVTLLRRDIVKMIEAGLSDGAAGDWLEHQAAYHAIMTRLPRSAPRPILEQLGDELQTLRDAVHDLLKELIKTKNLDGNESQNERHIQNTAPNKPVESNFDRRRSNDRHVNSSAFGEEALRRKPGAGGAAAQEPDASGKAADSDILNISLSLVKQACPDVEEALPDIFSTWATLRGANQALCRMAYINPQVAEQARGALGPDLAIVALAVTVQRASTGEVKNPGAYLRGLIQKASKGELFLSRSLFALAKIALGGTN